MMSLFRPAKIIVSQGHRTSTSLQKIPDIWRRRIYRFSGNCFLLLSRLQTVGWIFFSVNKHLSNNEQTDNVLREKKNILFLFFFFLLFLQRTIWIWKPTLAIQNMKVGVFFLWWAWVLPTESRVHWRKRDIQEMSKKGRWVDISAQRI